MNYWASTFVQQDALFDFTYWGAIDAHMADSAVIENNFVSGAQRTGILYRGGLCSGVVNGQGMNHSIQNNIVHGAFAGVAVYPDYPMWKVNSAACVAISGFTVFKSVHFGIYYQNAPSVVLDSNILVDNQVGIYTFILGPSVLDHVLSGKTCQIKNTVIVGRSSSFNCSTDLKPKDFNARNAPLIFAVGCGADNAGMCGLTIADFISRSNGMTDGKPW
jgi:hypothetical protein